MVVVRWGGGEKEEGVTEVVLILLGSLLVLRTGGQKLTCYSCCFSNCEQKRRHLIISYDLIPFMDVGLSDMSGPGPEALLPQAGCAHREASCR